MKSGESNDLKNSTIPAVPHWIPIGTLPATAS
jgi:hypothetical protein